MARKRALVVDDSKSARMVLRKMLERHDLEVDTAESAEDALDYLLHQQPHVIFMDHMMPGMDGFQAVQAIKSDPRTATIPIMMYTSKQGEVYVGEARALGAVGVLPKEVKPADLVRVLENLHLLKPENEPAPVAAPLIAAPPAEPAAAGRIASLAREAAEEAVEHFMAGRLETLRENLRTDLRDELQALSAQLTPPQAEPPRRSRLALAAALAALLVLPLAYLFRPQALPATSPVVPAAVTPAPAAVTEQAQLLRTLAVQRMRTTQERARLLDTVSWALNQSGHFEFGQLAFGDERLGVISDLLARLSAVGFEGVVRLESHIGKFCLARDGAGELRLAAPELALQRCDSLGFDRELAQSLGERQSVAFANFLSSSPLVGGKIRLELISRGDEHPRHQYPSTASVATAGQWNALARRNQRVEVSLISAP